MAKYLASSGRVKVYLVHLSAGTAITSSTWRKLAVSRSEVEYKNFIFSMPYCAVTLFAINVTLVPPTTSGEISQSLLFTSLPESKQTAIWLPRYGVQSFDLRLIIEGLNTWNAIGSPALG